jgi:hypothetical protein
MTTQLIPVRNRPHKPQTNNGEIEEKTMQPHEAWSMEGYTPIGTRQYDSWEGSQQIHHHLVADTFAKPKQSNLSRFSSLLLLRSFCSIYDLLCRWGMSKLLLLQTKQIHPKKY